MKILVFGSTGMLGHTLIKYLQNQNSLEVEFTVRDKTKQKICQKIFGKEANFLFDAEHPESALDAIRTFQPNICINCLGLIKQKDDSKNYLKSIRINSLIPHIISEYCKEYDSKLIHISTDCVYSGRKGNYSEEDLPDPLDFYGRSKLLGEVSNNNALTIRTSIIGPELGTSKGLFEWFRSCDEVAYGYSNAWFSGFPTVELSRIIFEHIISKNIKNDIYNLSSKPINKFNLLRLINDAYGLNKKILVDESVKVDRTLDCSKFIKETNFVREEWEVMIDRMKSFK